MNIIEFCANKIDPKSLAFMQTSMYWILGREWLLAMGKSSDSWTASCLDVMQSIKAGFLSPTPEQQDNLRVAITDEGASYLLAVESAINASTQNPPGTFQGLCAFAPVPFACFAGRLATNYAMDREQNDGVNRLQQVLQGDWRDPVMTATCDAIYGDKKEYQPVLPYGNPAGIDPGFAAEPPVKKDDTTTTPPDPGIPAPPPKKDDTTTPPAPAAPGYWSKWGWPIGIGAAALAVVGGVFYFGKSKPHALPGRSNPSSKDNRIYVRMIGIDEDGVADNGMSLGPSLHGHWYVVYTMDGDINDVIDSTNQKAAYEWAQAKYPERPTNYSPRKKNPSRKGKTFTDHGNYLDLIGTEGGNLTLRPTPEGVEKAKELLEERENARQSILLDETWMLEDHMGNEWEYIRPEEVGALTEGTIISKTAVRDDNGDLKSVDRVYWHERYQIEDPVETWAEGRDVFFQGA